MNCPHCGHAKSSVLETRTHDGETWRRRRCHGCRGSFFSQEVASVELRFPQAVTDVSLARLRARREKAKPIPAPIGRPTSGFTGWGSPGTGATQ